MACEPIGPDQTKIIIGGNMPWIEESTDSSRLEEIIQGTATNIKTLIETETQRLLLRLSLPDFR